MPSVGRIRAVIARVPRGKVITYGQAAAAAGFPRAARATVWALQGVTGLPWHRVVAAGGRIALQGAEGREQRLRLELEGVTFRGRRVRMDLHGWAPKARRAPDAAERVATRTGGPDPWGRSTSAR
jgi:methylated-DNA-protein-cysteine methyltransferase related protein